MGSKLLTAIFFVCKLCFLLFLHLFVCFFLYLFASIFLCLFLFLLVLSFFLFFYYLFMLSFLVFLPSVCLCFFVCLSYRHLFAVCFFFSLSVCVLCLTLLSVFFHVHVALPLFLLFTLMSVFFHVHVVSPSMLWHILCNRSLVNSVTRYALFCLLHYFLSLFVIFLNNLFRKLFQVWSIHLAFK